MMWQFCKSAFDFVSNSLWYKLCTCGRIINIPCSLWARIVNFHCFCEDGSVGQAAAWCWVLISWEYIHNWGIAFQLYLDWWLVSEIWPWMGPLLFGPKEVLFGANPEKQRLNNKVTDKSVQNIILCQRQGWYYLLEHTKLLNYIYSLTWPCWSWHKTRRRKRDRWRRNHLGSVWLVHWKQDDDDDGVDDEKSICK